MRYALSFTLLLACAPDKEGDTSAPLDTADTAAATSVIDGRVCPPGSPLTWQSFGQGFLLDHCVGCHSSQLAEGQRAQATLGVDFDTQPGAQQWLQRIYARSADANDTMPPAGGVTEQQRQLLGDWLACGAP